MIDRESHRRRTERQNGFTLIELLVVVVILGILIAIAIPVYLNYRRSANDKAAQSDLRGLVSVLEQCFGDNNAYPAAATFTAPSGTVCTGRTTSVSTGTTINYYPVSATDLSGYMVGATNAAGSGKNYCYHSGKAGQVTTTSSAVVAYRLAGCVP